MLKPLSLSPSTFLRAFAAPRIENAAPEIKNADGEIGGEVFDFAADHRNDPWNAFVYRIGCLLGGFKEKYVAQMIARGLDSKRNVVKDSLYVLQELMNLNRPTGNRGDQFKVTIALGSDTTKTMIFQELPNNSGVKIYWAGEEEKAVIQKGNLKDMHEWLNAKLGKNSNPIAGRLFIYGDYSDSSAIDEEESPLLMSPHSPPSPLTTDSDTATFVSSMTPGTPYKLKTGEQLPFNLGGHKSNHPEMWVKLTPTHTTNSAMSAVSTPNGVANTLSPAMRVLGGARVSPTANSPQPSPSLKIRKHSDLPSSPPASPTKFNRAEAAVFTNPDSPCLDGLNQIGTRVPTTTPNKSNNRNATVTTRSDEARTSRDSTTSPAKEGQSGTPAPTTAMSPRGPHSTSRAYENMDMDYMEFVTSPYKLAEFNDLRAKAIETEGSGNENNELASPTKFRDSQQTTPPGKKPAATSRSPHSLTITEREVYYSDPPSDLEYLTQGYPN